MTTDDTSYPLDEFVSFKRVEDKATGTFSIILEGPLRYSALIATKVGELRISQEELAQYVERT